MPLAVVQIIAQSSRLHRLHRSPGLAALRRQHIPTREGCSKKFSTLLAPRKGVQHRRARRPARQAAARPPPQDATVARPSWTDALPPPSAPSRLGPSSSATSLNEPTVRRSLNSAANPPNATTPVPAAPHVSSLDAAAERAALEWIRKRVQPYLVRRPLEAVECSNPHQLAAILEWYGFGIGGWVALKASSTGSSKSHDGAQPSCSRALLCRGQQ